MKYIIFGNKGQLGKEFLKLLNSRNIECLGYDLPDYDICNYLFVSELIEVQKPDVVINCAAYNNVDSAEYSFEEAYRTNVAGVEILAIVCERNNVKFVHYSTDYVFDGIRKIPGFYSENDETNPINTYGATKLQGEKVALSKNPNSLIFRTSWLYGDGERNFINSVLKWADENEHIKIANNEFSIPTSTRLVADLTLKAINNNLSGIYHLVNTGYASRLDWAKIIIEQYEKNVIIYPALTKDFPTLAKRPPFSVMSNEKISTALQIEIPHWKTEFIEFVKNMKDLEKKKHPNLRQIRNETGIIEL